MLSPAPGALPAGLGAVYACRNPSVASNPAVVGPYRSYHTWEEWTVMAEEEKREVGRSMLQGFHITCWQLLETLPLSLLPQRLSSFLNSSELFHHSLGTARRKTERKYDLLLSVLVYQPKQCLTYITTSTCCHFSFTHLCSCTLATFWPHLNFSMCYCNGMQKQYCIFK